MGILDEVVNCQYIRPHNTNERSRPYATMTLLQLDFSTTCCQKRRDWKRLNLLESNVLNDMYNKTIKKRYSAGLSNGNGKEKKGKKKKKKEGKSIYK